MRILGRDNKSDFFKKLPPFKQRMPWIGADLQTLRNALFKVPTLNADDYHWVKVDKGQQQLALAINNPDGEWNGKLLLLAHGLGGSAESSYMVATAKHFLQAGWQVARLNYRGVGRSLERSHAPYSGGLTGDFRDVINSLMLEYSPEGLYLMGYSLGGHLILRTLGEGIEKDNVQAALTVSAPLHLGEAEAAISKPRNKLYHHYVVKQMRRDFVPGPNARYTKDPQTYRRIRDFDEYLIAPTFGFKGADDYYDRVSARGLIGNIAVPTLAIHALDDSWIPNNCYENADWQGKDGARALLLRYGGHVGFHGAADSEAWFNSTALRFFSAMGSN